MKPAPTEPFLECVANISVGVPGAVRDSIVASAGAAVLDVHSDPDHNRTVVTMVGEDAVRHLTRTTVELVDLSAHTGVHPRIGVVDVVPFVALAWDDDGRVVEGDMALAVAARDRFMRWAADELELPCFGYGPERSLPEVRRGAFTELVPDTGPDRPHPTAGAVAVGARTMLVAYNLWVDATLERAREVAKAVRGPGIRALGLQVGDRVQVSMNLTDPLHVGPDAAVEAVAAEVAVTGAELVGLVPSRLLDRIEPARWPDLDLAPGRTLEARMGATGPA